MSYVKNCFCFRASLWDLISGTNFMAMRPIVSEILTPQMAVSCQKEQMPLTANVSLETLELISRQYVDLLTLFHQ